MASIRFLVQGIHAGHGHLGEVNNILALNDLTQSVVSVAFITAKGVTLLAEQLSKMKVKPDFFIGIRNGITTIQAIKLLLDHGIKPYCVDTGSNSILFHPKIYLSRSSSIGRALVGSSNLTPSGLGSNFEAACAINFNLVEEADSKDFSVLISSIEKLKKLPKDNVYQVDSLSLAIELFNDGLLVDERTVRISSVGVAVKKNGKSRIKIIPREWDPHPGLEVDLAIAGIPDPTAEEVRVEAGSASVKIESLNAEYDWVEVWVSSKLSERDLNIPKGTTTNPTGSMLLKAGEWTHIPFQSYFRDSVFNKLKWSQGSAPHLGTATANFEIIIGGIKQGVFNLIIGHNYDTNTVSYVDKNAMTSLRWGSAKAIIARDDLLGRTLRLYRAKSLDGLFRIVID